MRNNMLTEFGHAIETNTGYYRISSHNENLGKMLHKLIWEKWYGLPVPQGYHIHHINGDKSDNRIQNLQCVTQKAHNRFHTRGRSVSLETMKKRSIQTNTTGYFRVSKHKDKTYKQGFIYSYRYWENGKFKSLYSVDINKLEKKVKEKGLPWVKFEEVLHE